MPKGLDVFGSVKLVPLLYPLDFDTNVEGPLVLKTGFNGIAAAILEITEDASQASTEKLDVTIHAVDSDSETLDSSNQVCAFTQVVGSNDTGVTVVEVKAIDLKDCPAGKSYLQAKLTETNTYEGIVSITLALGGAADLPVSQ